MAQGPIAHSQPVLMQLFHQGRHDAGSGEDDFGAAGLQTRNVLPLHGFQFRVGTDLTLYFSESQNSALNPIGIIRHEPQAHGGHIGDGPTDADKRVRRRDGIEPNKFTCDGCPGGSECPVVHGAVEAKLLRQANGTQVQAELFKHVPVVAEKCTWVLPPPVSNTTTDPFATPSPTWTAR